jgi:hypothetical protein
MFEKERDGREGREGKLKALAANGVSRTVWRRRSHPCPPRVSIFSDLVAPLYIMFVTCPHCNGLVEIEAINCRIFRHGWIVQTNQQLPPHATKEECDLAVRNGLIGCGKPFELVKDQDTWIAKACDYI